MQNFRLTIFTPTYNRSAMLPILYKSLLKQKCKEFKWMIIDDGSTDETESLVRVLSEEGQIEIEYIFKINGGKHTAINRMIEEVKSPYVFIVDSDDYLEDTAVTEILNDINSIDDNVAVGGIVYLRKQPNQKIIGTQFPYDKEVTWVNNYYFNKKVTGDKCEVFRTDYLKGYRFPEYENENFMGEGVLYIPFYHKYKALVRNKAIYYCEYMEHGLSKAGRKLRINNPMGGIAHAEAHLLYYDGKKMNIKYTMLYTCYSIFAKKKRQQILKECKERGYSFLGYLGGILLYYYWNAKYM